VLPEFHELKIPRGRSLPTTLSPDNDWNVSKPNDNSQDSHHNEHVLQALGFDPGVNGKENSHASDIADKGNSYKSFAGDLRRWSVTRRMGAWKPQSYLPLGSCR